MTTRRLAPSVAGMLVLLVSAAANAQQADQTAQQAKQEKKADFLRITREDDKSPVAMEVAVVSLAKAAGDGPTVDLISAVHVGEKAYYDELNRRFEDYDVVLYELVAPEGTTVPKGGVGRSNHPVSMLQSFMTGILELEFQLNAVDYTRPNLVHADMSPEQFAESMRERGESAFQVFFRMMGYAMSQQSGDAASGDAALLVALFSKNRALAMKRVLAEQFQDLEGSLTAIEGPDGSTLISERNKVALKVLKEQIDAGHKRLAIFYGAGHMFDFSDRLQADFGLAPVKTEWLVAWDLKGKSPAKSDRPAKEPPEGKAGEASEAVQKNALPVQ